MDPVLVTALIGAGTNVTTIGVAVYQNRQKVKAERAKADAERGVQKIGGGAGLATVAAAYTVEVWKIKASFGDDGSGEKLKTWNGLRPTQTIQDLTIPHEVKLQHQTTGTQISKPTVEMPGSPAGVTLLTSSITRPGGDLISTAEVRINGRVDTNSLLNINLRQAFDGGFCMTKEEAEAVFANDRWKLDYQAARIPVPTGKVRIQVTFPPSFGAMAPVPSAVVFYGDTEIVHDAETDRANEAGVSYEGGIAVLEMDNPLVGLAYAITWMPPPARKAASGSTPQVVRE